MRVDGDAAPIVGHAQEPVGFEVDLDAIGVALDRLVHGVVEHLGEEVMQGLLVGAADIHAGAPTHGLQAFQHLDIGGGVGVLGAGPRRPLAALRRRGGRNWLLLQLVLELGEEIA